jgi:hypothetical protein
MALSAAVPAAAASEAAPRHVEIAAGPMDDALKRLALQARLQLLYEPDVVSGRSARALRGEYSPAMPCGSCWPAAACGLRRQARNLRDRAHPGPSTSGAARAGCKTSGTAGCRRTGVGVCHRQPSAACRRGVGERGAGDRDRPPSDRKQRLPDIVRAAALPARHDRPSSGRCFGRRRARVPATIGSGGHDQSGRAGAARHLVPDRRPAHRQLRAGVVGSGRADRSGRHPAVHRRTRGNIARRCVCHLWGRCDGRRGQHRARPPGRAAKCR